MRILIISSKINLSSGPSNVLINIANGLANLENVEVGILCAYIEDRRALPSCVVMPILKRGLSGYFGDVGRIFSTAKAYDAIYIPVGGIEWVLLALGAKLSNRPVSVGPNVYLILKKRICGKLFSLLFDLFICFNVFQARKLASCGVNPSKVTILPNSVDTKLFRPIKNKRHVMDELKLIYVGRLERRKGILDLIEAVRILEAEGRRLRLVICSSRGKLTGMIERICQKFDFIDFRGYVNREELIEEYSNADLAVFPSEREPFGMVFLEAMSCGLPVIGVKRGGPQLIVDDMVNGILIQRRGAKEIAEAIEYFVDNPKEIVRMGNNAREKMAKEYSKEKVAGRFLRAVHHKATDGHRVRLKCNF